MRATRVNPDIKSIATLAEIGRKTQLLAEFFITEFKPDIGAMIADEVSNLADNIAFKHSLAIFIKENGKRNAPCSLARDTPVRTSFDGTVYTISTPGR
jgi:hypothetical protein